MRGIHREQHIRRNCDFDLSLARSAFQRCTQIEYDPELLVQISVRKGQQERRYYMSRNGFLNSRRPLRPNQHDQDDSIMGRHVLYIGKTDIENDLILNDISAGQIRIDFRQFFLGRGQAKGSDFEDTFRINPICGSNEDNDTYKDRQLPLLRNVNSKELIEFVAQMAESTPIQNGMHAVLIGKYLLHFEEINDGDYSNALDQCSCIYAEDLFVWKQEDIQQLKRNIHNLNHQQSFKMLRISMRRASDESIQQHLFIVLESYIKQQKFELRVLKKDQEWQICKIQVTYQSNSWSLLNHAYQDALQYVLHSYQDCSLQNQTIFNFGAYTFQLTWSKNRLDTTILEEYIKNDYTPPHIQHNDTIQSNYYKTF